MADLIKNIYQKGTTGSTAIGTDGENVSLTITSKHSSEGNDNAIAAINSTNRIYYNNVQAQMVRKGIQINNLNSTIYGTGASDSGLINKVNALTNATSQYLRSDNGGLTWWDVDQYSGSGLDDVEFVLSNMSTIEAGNVDGAWWLTKYTAATAQNQVDTLQKSYEYLAAANPLGLTSTITAYDGPNHTTTDSRGITSSPYILGQDGLYNIGSKFNALYDTVINYIAEQTASTNTMTDAELIQRYGIDHQGQHFIVQSSKIQCSLGWPSTASSTKMNLDGGHMRYRVYEGDFLVEKAPSEGIPAINTNIHFGPNTRYKSYIAKNYTVSSSSRLYDIDQLPSAPRGYKWKCVYVRGTYPYPNMNETNILTTDRQYYMLWEKLDGYSTINGYLNGGWELSFDLPVQNLYKGTSFDNLERAQMSQDIWQAINLTNSSTGFDAENTIKYSFASAAGSTYGGVHGYLNNLPSMKAVLWGNMSTTRKYLYKRPRYQFRRDAESLQDFDNPIITKIGSRFSPQDKLRYSLSAQPGTKDGVQFWDYFHNYENNNWQGNGPAVLSLRDWPISLVFKDPFMYAEYVLVPVSTVIYTDEWYNLNPTDEYHGDDEDSGGTDPQS